ncbi:TRAP transporter substrate-binding protein [Paracidovorax anthurii]|uniref:Tripartite ATP-independent transporter DctP family solute receptor n=1 Tax=Paracidovorax anthurii TaxID=78229 RepID=A0A328Z1U6_9BURK|nr:TRAP transporter substrate-binding protein [Paracidovorax anthurii]RAR76216.1 tripartite ATP-independent transporter DctP family solute receptor [Paracidovorax anthurii]WCM93850.1 TRAP transporter substrate-binding protein [Acidovorax sp. NCPPB 2350]
MRSIPLLRRTLLAAVLAAGASLASAQAVKLTLAHGNPPDNPRHLAALKFAETVKARTDGRVEIQVAHSAQLGDDAAMVTGLRSGTLDFSANSQGAVAAVVPEFAALGMPFLFADVQKAWSVMDGAIGKELADKTAAKGMILLGLWDNGVRQMSNSKRPIKTPADMKGLKMRTPPDAVTVDIMQALGADAQQIKFSELYVALQQGVVDGQENPLTNIASAKLYEVQKYISLTGHKYESTPFLMSKRTWDRMAPADRQVVVEAAAEATQLQRQLNKDIDDRLVADLQAKGVQVDTVDRAAFMEAARPVYAKWLASPIGAFVGRVQQAAR